MVLREQSMPPALPPQEGPSPPGGPDSARTSGTSCLRLLSHCSPGDHLPMAFRSPQQAKLGLPLFCLCGLVCAPIPSSP